MAGKILTEAEILAKKSSGGTLQIATPATVVPAVAADPVVNPVAINPIATPAASSVVPSVGIASNPNNFIDKQINAAVQGETTTAPQYAGKDQYTVKVFNPLAEPGQVKNIDKLMSPEFYQNKVANAENMVKAKEPISNSLSSVGLYQPPIVPDIESTPITKLIGSSLTLPYRAVGEGIGQGIAELVSPTETQAAKKSPPATVAPAIATPAPSAPVTTATPAPSAPVTTATPATAKAATMKREAPVDAVAAYKSGAFKDTNVYDNNGVSDDAQYEQNRRALGLPVGNSSIASKPTPTVAPKASGYLPAYESPDKFAEKGSQEFTTEYAQPQDGYGNSVVDNNGNAVNYPAAIATDTPATVPTQQTTVPQVSTTNPTQASSVVPILASSQQRITNDGSAYNPNASVLPVQPVAQQAIATPRVGNYQAAQGFDREQIQKMVDVATNKAGNTLGNPENYRAMKGAQHILDKVLGYNTAEAGHVVAARGQDIGLAETSANINQKGQEGAANRANDAAKVGVQDQQAKNALDYQYSALRAAPKTPRYQIKALDTVNDEGVKTGQREVVFDQFTGNVVDNTAKQKQQSSYAAAIEREEAKAKLETNPAVKKAMLEKIANYKALYAKQLG